MLLSMIWNLIVISISSVMLLYWVRQILRIMPARPATKRTSIIAGSLI
jgi:hypothetical protein